MFIEEIVGAFTGQNRRTRHRQVATGVGLGLLVGSVAALLLAPKSGKETREDIVDLANKSLDKTKELARQGVVVASDITDNIRHRVSNIKDVLQDKFEDIKELSEEELAELAQQLGETLEDLEDVEVEIECACDDECSTECECDCHEEQEIK